MSDKGTPEFPNVESKLQQPSKQSAFERQKAEAEAKRRREAEETAAVYEDFVKSFDRDENDYEQDRNQYGREFGSARLPGRPPFGGTGGPAPVPGKRHFGTSGLKSGPGSLGPPPAAFGKKRSFEDFTRSGGSNGIFAGKDSVSVGPDDHLAGLGNPAIPTVFETSDDEEMGREDERASDRAVAKPTLRLADLPLGTSPGTIKALLSDYLTVENVKILPPVPQSGTERKSMVAIATLSQETPANEMDGAVSALQNRYLGYGHYLSLHRHLSSAVASSVALPTFASSSGSQPYGAKPVEEPTLRHGPGQQAVQRGFAPPPSYARGHSGISRTNLLHVCTKPPQDIKTIQLINMVIEGVLENGPEFEALLMSRPEVQREEKWAWIWDARSQGGVWYRWRLWEVVTGGRPRNSKVKYIPLFDGSNAWKTPEKTLPFEYTTKLDEFVSDSEFDSSDEDEIDEEMIADKTRGEDNEKTFLNPLEKAKLTHLLARLPTSISRLRTGDIARVTAFAIMHASRGVDEVVDMMVSNVEMPFALTRASAERKASEQKGLQTQGIEDAGSGEDVSAATLVGLYVISDILSSSSTSGVRHAWRYRQLFEAVLKDRNIFVELGMMADHFGWGRLRAEKWRRSVSFVLNLWEGWCVFTTENHSLFANNFENPPSRKVEDKNDNTQKKGKWKVVDSSADAEASNRLPEQVAHEDYAMGEAVEEGSITGEAIDDEDVEGEPINDEDIAGEAIGDEDVEGEPMDEDEALSLEGAPGLTEAASGGAAQERQTGQGQLRRRMRAVDMFADSDEGDDS